MPGLGHLPSTAKEHGAIAVKYLTHNNSDDDDDDDNCRHHGSRPRNPEANPRSESPSLSQKSSGLQPPHSEGVQGFRVDWLIAHSI